MKLSSQQERFYKKWEKKRQNKLKYLLIDGLLFWATPVTLLLTIIHYITSRFVFSIDTVIYFFIVFIIAGAIGLLISHVTFKSVEKTYLELKEKNLI
jgi:hypothetical protein